MRFRPHISQPVVIIRWDLITGNCMKLPQRRASQDGKPWHMKFNRLLHRCTSTSIMKVICQSLKLCEIARNLREVIFTYLEQWSGIVAGSEAVTSHPPAAVKSWCSVDVMWIKINVLFLLHKDFIKTSSPHHNMSLSDFISLDFYRENVKCVCSRPATSPQRQHSNRLVLSLFSAKDFINAMHELSLWFRVCTVCAEGKN